MEVAHPKFLSDPGWVLSLWAILKGRHKGRAPFVERPAVAPPLAQRARIVLVGDWGSGLPRAIAVARRITERLAEPAVAHVQKHVIHLGDVYYTGERDEYLDNFLAHWPVAHGSDVASFALMGNHDMYSGGHAYYRTALADGRFARQQGSSMFVLANEHWQFLGIDTAYEDAGLHGAQAAWIDQLRTDNPGRRTALLSHHQLFSAHEDTAEKLREKIAPVLARQPLDAWFWGHEHRSIAYRDVQNVRYASCVGNGGIPEYLVPRRAFDGLVYEDDRKYGHGLEPWNTFGFAVLDVDGPEIAVTYVDETGADVWSTEIR